MKNEIVARLTYTSEAYKSSSCPHTQRYVHTISIAFNSMGHIILHLRNHQLSAVVFRFSCASSFRCPWKKNTRNTWGKSPSISSLILCEARIAGCGFGGWESGEDTNNPKTGRSTRWWWSWLMVVLVLLKLLVKVMVQQPWIADSGENLSILGILLKLCTHNMGS